VILKKKIFKSVLATILSFAAGKQYVAAEIAYQTHILPVPWKYVVSFTFVLTILLCVCLALECLNDAFPDPTSES